MPSSVDLDAFKSWSPAAQEKAAAALKEVQDGKWKPFFCPRPGCDGKPHDNWQWPHGRADQHPPKGDWLTWLIRGGRGSGKTRTGSEWTHRRTKVSPRIALVSPTVTSARETLIEGESGILATARPGEMPHYEPSKKRVTWPNGARGYIFTGEEPDQLRGPQHFDAWLDEPAHIPAIEDLWDNLLFGLRLGKHPRVCCTTTPKPTKWMKELIKDPMTVSVAVSTYANIDNLAPTFRSTIMRYEGTRKGRQELYGEVLEDVEGALWNPDLIEAARIKREDVDRDAITERLMRVVVGVDPAGTANTRSDETGIVVVGITTDGHYYVLEDASGKYSPHQWAQRVKGLYDSWQADKVVAEKNYGGDMVKFTLRSADENMPIEIVTSRRGKALRADPVVALYERGLVHHWGLHSSLEDQMCSWVVGEQSPDRVDALVHAVTALEKHSTPASIALPTQLRSLV